MSDETEQTDQRAGSWIVSLVVSAVVLLAAGGLAVLTFFTEPTAQKGGASKRTPMLVEVEEAEVGDHSPRIVAQGTVRAPRDIELRPQVGGRVVSLADNFTPGGRLEAGELMMRIERADYEHELARRKSELRQAESELTVERGRHDAAAAEYDRFGEDLSSENEALVLRKPQLEAAEQRVESARAAVEQAKLNLRRTRVEAPFDAHVVRRDVNVGSQVSSSDTVARLVGTDRYWVEIDLPLPKLQWVEIGNEEGEGSEVQVRNRQAWPEGTHRSGRITEKIGALDDETRMIRLLATIRDPLALETEDTPSLTVGEFVEASIRGEQLEDVVRLERDYLRENDTVWVMKDEKLHIADVDVAVRDAKYAYVADGLEEGAKVVTTSLSTVRDGAPLRLDANDEGAGGE